MQRSLLVFLAVLLMSASAATARETASPRETSRGPSRSNRRIPTACRRRPNGSPDPFGPLPMEKNPASVSSFSASVSNADGPSEGTGSPCRRGK